MKRHFWRIALFAVVAIVSAATAAYAGGCFCWMDDGSASEAFIANSEADCAAMCGGYDRHYYTEGNASLEGPDKMLLVIRETDTQNLDGDGDTTEIIRWRYVVLIECRISGNECQEKRSLVRCWKDDNHD